jgi:hypothetical protein
MGVPRRYRYESGGAAAASPTFDGVHQAGKSMLSPAPVPQHLRRPRGGSGGWVGGRGQLRKLEGGKA